MAAPLITVPRVEYDKPEPVVLIVNRDRSTRSWIEATASSMGLRAMSFASDGELLSGFVPGKAACAILDLVLPDASAFELQDTLSRAGASVIFLTREHCITSCVRAVKAGAVDFLTLPCEPTELVRALCSAVRQTVCSWTQREHLRELRSRFEQLTPREREVLAFVSSGLLNKQIAQQLEISEVTVQIHRGRVMRKMSARSFAELVRMADALRELEAAHYIRRRPVTANRAMTESIPRSYVRAPSAQAPTKCHLPSTPSPLTSPGVSLE